jgi:hypothetical protein
MSGLTESTLARLDERARLAGDDETRALVAEIRRHRKAAADRDRREWARRRLIFNLGPRP